jgi:hypothetical protein
MAASRRWVYQKKSYGVWGFAVDNEQQGAYLK